ncbi:MAG: icmT [Gammaproteobacteria bacterium]|nr:icmT [Gammaproteobacteria bacterium]
MAKYRPDAHWRDSARPACFWFLDCRAAFPFLFCLLHIRVWTLVVALIATLFFATLERYGFTVYVFWRWLRSTAAGKRRAAIPWWLD